MGITFAQNCSQRQCYRLEFICTFKYTFQFSANFCFFHSAFLHSIMFQTYAHDLKAMISHCQCLGLKSTWLKNLSPDFAKIFNSASIWIFYGRKGTFGGSSVSFRNGNAPFLSLWTNTKLLCRWERSKEEKIPNKYLQQGSSEKVFFTWATSRLRDFGMQLGDFFPIGKSVEVGSTPGQTPLKL